MRRTRASGIGAALLLATLAFVGTGEPVAHADPAMTWPDVSRPVPVTAEGSGDAAVVIGIDEYVFVPHVPGAVTNARDWYTFLIESRKVPIDKVHLMRNAQATREGMLKMAGVAAKEVGPNGTLWFIFIGHGAPSKDGDDGILVGADAQQDADSIFARSVAQQEIIRTLSSARSQNRVMVLDACFSGRTGSGAPIAAGLQPLIRVKEVPPTQNVLVMSAGAADQFAGPLPGGNRPAFSYLVLGALRGWAGTSNGEVTAADSVNYARKVLNMMPIGRTQEPKMAGTIPNTTLAHHATEKGPDLHRMLVGPETTPPPSDDPEPTQPQYTPPTRRNPPQTTPQYSPPSSYTPQPHTAQTREVPSPWRTVLVYGAVGFSVAAVGFGSLAATQAKTAVGDCDTFAKTCNSSYSSDKQKAMTSAIIADVALGLGVVSLVGAFLIPNQKVSVGAAPLPGGFVASAQKSF